MCVHRSVDFVRDAPSVEAARRWVAGNKQGRGLDNAVSWPSRTDSARFGSRSLGRRGGSHRAGDWDRGADAGGRGRAELNVMYRPELGRRLDADCRTIPRPRGPAWPPGHRRVPERGRGRGPTAGALLEACPSPTKSMGDNRVEEVPN
jgi:hypothetical protein